MRVLDRKLTRDLLQIKGQVLAICLVIASGVATCVMSLSTLESLRLTQTAYYERYRFGQIFAHLKRAPHAMAGRIAAIPGVAQVQTRIVEDVTLDIRGMAQPAVGRFISIRDAQRPPLNQVHLRSGRYLQPDAPAEVLASQAFTEAHGLGTGDRIIAVVNGRRQAFTIVGIVLSPEYVLQMRSGDVLPDPKRFGVFWVNQDELAAAFDMEGAFNDVSLTLLPGASEPEVLKRLDELIDPYGGVGAHGRADQLSHRYVSDEIKQLRGMGLVAPAIFLCVASFLLNVVLWRLIDTQREQIGALKAFGYGRITIGLHYLKFVLVILAGGMILGTALGAWLGRGLTRLYTQFYQFPVFHFSLDAQAVGSSLLLCSMAAAVGTIGAVGRAIRLRPAQAMRPAPPAPFRVTIFERCGFTALLSGTGRMILRRLAREPVRALLSCLGISLSVAVLVLGGFTRDAIDYLVEYQFHLAQRQDVSLTFVEPTSVTALHDVAHLPGALQCEGFRVVPVRMRFEHRWRRLGIMGLVPRGELYRLMDKNGRVVSVPPEGMVLSAKLAQLLGVRVGQIVTIQVQEGSRRTWNVPVTGLIADYSGTNAYMDIRTVDRLMREGNTISGVFMTVDPKYMDQLYSTLKTTPRIASVTVKRAMLESFWKTIGENQLRIQLFNGLFAVVIAFGVVYNLARIWLSERGRELATLRVIGFTRGEISVILFGELAVLTGLAIPLGLLFGYGFAVLETLAFDTDLYRIPLIINHSTYAWAATVVIVASLVSGLIVRQRLDRLDLVAVLKSKE